MEYILDSGYHCFDLWPLRMGGSQLHSLCNDHNYWLESFLEFFAEEVVWGEVPLLSENTQQLLIFRIQNKGLQLCFDQFQSCLTVIPVW